MQTHTDTHSVIYVQNGSEDMDYFHLIYSNVKVILVCVIFLNNFGCNLETDEKQKE